MIFYMFKKTVVGQLRTVSLRDNSHPTGVVYQPSTTRDNFLGYNKRGHHLKFQLTNDDDALSRTSECHIDLTLVRNETEVVKAPSLGGLRFDSVGGQRPHCAEYYIIPLPTWWTEYRLPFIILVFY